MGEGSLWSWQGRRRVARTGSSRWWRSSGGWRRRWCRATAGRARSSRTPAAACCWPGARGRSPGRRDPRRQAPTPPARTLPSSPSSSPPSPLPPLPPAVQLRTTTVRGDEARGGSIINSGGTETAVSLQVGPCVAVSETTSAFVFLPLISR